MLAWLVDNLATITICVILAVVPGAVVAVIIKNKRNGGSSCGCGCGDCPMDGACHKNK